MTAIMKVQEETHHLVSAPAQEKSVTSLVRGSSDVMTSSSDGSDSGCLAESPDLEIAKDYQSDSERHECEIRRKNCNNNFSDDVISSYMQVKCNAENSRRNSREENDTNSYVAKYHLTVDNANNTNHSDISNNETSSVAQLCTPAESEKSPAGEALDSTNANCHHEISFSLSQLSDYEATKQKITEMRKTFLTSLGSSAASEDKDNNSNSSFLAHLQDKRARRMRQRIEKQNNSPKHSELSSVNSPPLFIKQSTDEYFLAAHNFDESNRRKSNNIISPPSYTASITQYVTGSHNANCNVNDVNANRSISPHSSSLPPSTHCSPIHNPTAATNANFSQVLRTNSTPNTPLRSAVTPVSLQTQIDTPLRKLCLQNQLGQTYDESISRSADAKYFNCEQRFDYSKVYLRTRSLEDSAWSPNRTNKNTAVIKKPSSKNLFSSLNCTKYARIDVVPSQNSFHNEDNLRALMASTRQPIDSSNDNGNAWLKEKTAKLLKLRRDSAKDKINLADMYGERKLYGQKETKKGKIKEACKGMARALFSYPNSPERVRVTRSHSPPSLSCSPHTGPSSEEREDASLCRQVRRRQHLLYTAESSPRNSFHYSCACVGGQCNCPASRYRQVFTTNWQHNSPINRPNSAPNITDSNQSTPVLRKNRPFRRKNFSTSDDDYADDADDDYSSFESDCFSSDDSNDDRAANFRLVSSPKRRNRREYSRNHRLSRPVTTHGVILSDEQALHKDLITRRMRNSRPKKSNGNVKQSSPQHVALGSIRENYGTSDTQCYTDSEELSRDGSNCDLSRSWRFGLSRDFSRESTLCSNSSKNSICSDLLAQYKHNKSNSLPGAYNRNVVSSNPRPESALLRPKSTCDEDMSKYLTHRVHPPSRLLHNSPIHVNSGRPNMPAMGIQGLQRSPNHTKTSPLHTIPGLPPSSPRMVPAPRTVVPRSPNNPNPPYGFDSQPGPTGSPRVSCRAKGLVSRNFSISDDENNFKSNRRLVTIVRNESVVSQGNSTPAVDPDWLSWKLGVLQKTVEDVDNRLDEAEKTLSAWGPVPQDQSMADQHVGDVTKFRESLADLQRGIDDVNDQAARFSAHNVPLSTEMSTSLHRLNTRWKGLEGSTNERWRQVAGRSRDITPLTAAQLATSVTAPWERSVATNKVPYYINHAQETTYWDHPEMMQLLDSLADLNHIKFSAYRTAAKLRTLQKKLALDDANLQMVTDVFDEHGLRGQNDRLIDVSDMVVVLSTLYGRIGADRPDINSSLTTDMCLNWLLNVYDSQRTGQMRVLSFRVGLVCLCRGHLEEKYRYMFRLIADPNRLVDQRKLGLLLHDCVQVPRQMGEVAAFGGSNIEPSVRSCFTKAGKDRENIEAVHFLSWVSQEPQSLVWLAVLHRVAASEGIQHMVKCNICKKYPLTGLRYRCLKCIGFDMCQQCFFEGRSSKSHKVTHPMHEYCTATKAGDEMKDFTKALKNKFKSKRSLQKHTKKGYLPVQTVLEGDPLESPSPSPQHAGGADMHNRLEQYASRLAEVELRTNSNSTPDSEDEHGLIAQYCQSLTTGDGNAANLPVPKSPLQVMAAVDADQKDELEQMIRELEEENQALQAEYESLKLQQDPADAFQQSGQGSGGSPVRSEAEMLAEARLLRQHKGRLEARMTILEQHNNQLEAQLQRLRQLLTQNGGSPNKSNTLQTKSVTASQLATDSPAKVNGHPAKAGTVAQTSYEGLDQMTEYVRPPPPPMGNVPHVGNLFTRAGDLEKAVGSLVARVNQEDPPGGRGPSKEEELELYDNIPSC